MLGVVMVSAAARGCVCACVERARAWLCVLWLRARSGRAATTTTTHMTRSLVIL